jgi:hypothetical protein
VTFVFDMFDLGQPNLVLLAMMLYGFWSLATSARWLAGFMFAARDRHQGVSDRGAALSGLAAEVGRVVATVAFTGILLYVVPAPIRGFERNAAELADLVSGPWSGRARKRALASATSRTGRGSTNPSLPSRTAWFARSTTIRRIQQAAAHDEYHRRRLQDGELDRARAVGVARARLRRGHATATRRTARSDAEELGILFCLMTVASPLARQYYFMWLFFPMTVLMHRAAFDERANVRLGTWLALGAAGMLMLLALPWFPNAFQAWGNNLLAPPSSRGASHGTSGIRRLRLAPAPRQR